MDDGAVIASGRDAEIVDVGDGRVLRRPRLMRSLQAEAGLMRYLRAAGYPVPDVIELRTDGMVMERVTGRSMLDDLLVHPWRLGRHARSLARLHDQLHRIPALEGSRARYRAPAPDDVVTHGDLHPGNVLLTPDGPRVIDWSSGGRGPAGADVAEAWLLLAGAGVEANPLLQSLVRVLRGRFLAGFLGEAGRDQASRWLWQAVERREEDPHLTAAEKAAMQRVARRHSPQRR